MRKVSGVVWWCGGVVYLTSPGHPADSGLQLGKALQQVRVEGECFYLFYFFTFISVPLSSLSSSLLSLLGDDTK